MGSRDEDVEVFDESERSSRNTDTDDAKQSIFNDVSEVIKLFTFCIGLVINLFQECHAYFYLF